MKLNDFYAASNYCHLRLKVRRLMRDADRAFANGDNESCLETIMKLYLSFDEYFGEHQRIALSYLG